MSRNIGYDARAATCHRLEGGKTKPLVDRRRNKSMSCTIEIDQLLIVDTAGENNLRRVSLKRHILEDPCALSNDHKSPVLKCCAIPCFEQASEILSRFEGTDVEKEGFAQLSVEVRFLFELEVFTQAIGDHVDFDSGTRSREINRSLENAETVIIARTRRASLARAIRRELQTCVQTTPDGREWRRRGW